MDKLTVILVLLFVFYSFFRYHKKHGNTIRDRRNAILDRLSRAPEKK